MICIECAHYAFTVQGKNEDGDEKLACNSCGQVHVKTKKYENPYESTKPNNSTAIAEDQKWRLQKDESVWKVVEILIEPVVKAQLVREEDAPEDEESSKEIEPEKLIDRSTWNYRGAPF